MKIWRAYKDKLKSNFNVDIESTDRLGYWRNIMFSYAVIYILPFSLISYIPVTFYNWTNDKFLLIAIDTFNTVLVLLVGFLPKISLNTRKALFVFTLYLVAGNLLYTMGIDGPGFLYLYAAAFFCIIIFPNKYSYYPSFINIFICLLFAFLITLEIMPWSQDVSHNVPKWLTLCSDLVFLSFIASALIPMVFNGLEESIEKEHSMRLKLSEQKVFLEKTLKDLESKNEELEAFAFTTSHDLQEPLRMISSFLTQLKKKYGDRLDDKANQYIHYAVDGAKRMRQIILDLLDFSKADKYEREVELINLNELVDEVCVLMRKTIAEKSAEINKENLPSINGHRVALFQIFQNLISNALKYSNDDMNPIIHIAVNESKKEWLFSVKDNGIGINPEYFDKIFVIFQRLHLSNQYGGTGVGLALVKKIVENSGGKIWVESQEGIGSTFYFTIPKV